MAAGLWLTIRPQSVFALDNWLFKDRFEPADEPEEIDE